MTDPREYHISSRIFLRLWTRFMCTFLVVTIIEPEPWEGSGEPPEDWSPGEPEVITTEQTPNPHIIQALRVHQCILPIAVLALMWMLFKARAKALKVGAEIDAALEKEKAALERQKQLQAQKEAKECFAGARHI